MALSAGDGEIIAVVDDGPDGHEPRWTRLFPRRQWPHPVRRRVLTVSLALAWICVLCLDEAYRPGPWLWAALAATWAAIAPAVARSQIRRRR